MQEPVPPVEYEIFKDEVKYNLRHHLFPAPGEGEIKEQGYSR